jgi:CSLREA domain-containing protein
VAIAQALAVASCSVLAADIQVDDLSSSTGGPGCSLRDAITAANSDMAVAGCPSGSGFDRIMLSSGADIALTLVDNGDNCLPVVVGNLTIAGPGAAIRRDPSAPDCRILAIDGAGSAASLNLEQVTVSGGRVDGDGGGVLAVDASVTLNGANLSNNAAINGGGLAISGGTLVMQDSTISGNTASQRGGGLFTGNPVFAYAYSSTIIDNAAMRGGGGYFHAAINPVRSLAPNQILNAVREQGETLAEAAQTLGLYRSLLADTTLSGNLAQTAMPPRSGRGVGGSSGGGAHVASGFLYLLDSRVENNRADDLGGGLAAEFGILATVSSSVTGNTSGMLGGGVGLSYGYQVSVRTTIADNQASVGGGIGAQDSVSYLFKSTLSGNRALSGNRGAGAGRGGGLFGDFSNLILQDSTVSGNQAEIDAAALAWTKYGLSASKRSNGKSTEPGDVRLDRLINPTILGGGKYQVDIRHSTIAANTISVPNKGSGTAVLIGTGREAGLLNSILSNPGLTDCRTVDASLPSSLASLARDGSCGVALFGDPRLAPLADNGGETLTHRLNQGSSALAAGDPSVCASTLNGTDQTGAPRPSDGMTPCSIGSTQGVVILGGPVLPVPLASAWSTALMSWLMALFGYFKIRQRKEKLP